MPFSQYFERWIARRVFGVLSLMLFLFLGQAPARGENQAGQWRVILNNDGGDALIVGQGDGNTYEDDLPDPAQELLRRRTSGLENSGVTTISYCTGAAFGLVTHRSKVAEQWPRPEAGNETPMPRRLIERLNEQNTDCLHVMADYCKANGLELWWSMRMNDTHDVSHPKLVPLSNFKRQHPHVLFGKQGESFPYGKWSGVDYSHEEVHQFALSLFKEVLTNYSVQGIEMDFFRHPVLFSSVARTGEPASEKERMALKEFLGKARKLVDEHNSNLPPETKKVVLGARFPDSLVYCENLGFEVEDYLREHLLDFVIFGGYFRLSPWADSANLARRYGVPSYASIDNVTAQIPKEPITEEPDLHRRYGWITGIPDYRRPEFYRRADLESYRGRILSAVAQGHSGVAFFNLFNKRHAILKEVANLDEMALKPAKYFYMARGTQQGPCKFLENGNSYFTTPIINPAFPKSIPDAGLKVSLATRLPKGKPTGNAQLFLDFTGSGADAGRAAVKFNGKPLSSELSLAKGEAILTLPMDLVRDGVNEIEIVPGASSAHRLIRDVMLRVNVAP